MPKPFSFQEKFQNHLDKLSQKNLTRSLKTTNNLIDFSSNDYLALSRNKELHLKILSRLQAYSEQNLVGSTGSRLISGNYQLIEEVESELAQLHCCEAALFFSSGYAANIGLLQALPDRHDTIIYDALSHASIRDGTRLRHARSYSFKHNDLDDLKLKLNKAKGTPFIVIESLYSMDGDLAPLQEIVKISADFGAFLIIDEAHSSGIYGKYGAGYFNHLNIQPSENIIRLHTFGKGLGSHGACVVGTELVKKMLINTARSFIYSTSPAPHSIITIIEGYKYIKENPDLVSTLWSRCNQFIDKLQPLLISRGNQKIQASGPIFPFIIPGNKNVLEAEKYLHNQGLDVRAVRSPTVAEQQERLRISIHAFNTEEDLGKLIRALEILT